jgi:hypothetical protein
VTVDTPLFITKAGKNQLIRLPGLKSGGCRMGFCAVKVSTHKMFKDGRSDEVLAMTGRLLGSFFLRSSAKEKGKDHGGRYRIKRKILELFFLGFHGLSNHIQNLI